MLIPRMFFGLNTNPRKNIYCISNEEILYPAGGVIVLHNFQKKTQKYIKLPNPEKEISVIAVAVKKGYLAVAEKAIKGEKPRIFIYNLENLKRITTLGIPFEIDTQEFLQITFTHDGHHIAALTAGPDYFMYYFNWKSGKIESQAKANNPPSVPGPVTDMAINPKDATIVVFVGTSLFRLLSMSENVWRQYGFQKAQSFTVLSVCWLTDDRVLAGCKDGKVMIVQSGDLNGVYDINEETEINIIVTSESKKDQLKTLQRSLSKQMSSKQIQQKKNLPDIRCCTAIKTGFLYSQKPGEVVYFEKTSNTNYKKCTTFIIEKDVLCHDADYDSLYYVNCICTNLDGTLLLCTTNRSQIYWVPLQGNKSDIVEFNVFEEPLHHGPISGLSTCLWKPIFMTCGAFDNSVRLWSHEKMNVVLNQTFVETVNCISLHPTGLYALIGFSDKVRFFLVLIHELQVYREFGITDCKVLAFSNNGHLFAAECNNDILVYSSITFNKISQFRGNCQLITSLRWSMNDLILYSSSTNGAIYEWSIEKNIRISDLVLHDVAVKGLVALQNEHIVCIDSEGYLKEIKNSKVITSKKLNHENGECLDFVAAVENSKPKLILAGKNGIIISIKYPIEDEPQLNFFLMHNQSITQCSNVDRGRFFVSTDTAGTICIWDMSTTNMIGDLPTDDKFFDEILVNTDELAEKNSNLNHLSRRIEELTSEHAFEIKRKDDFNTNKVKELEERYTNEIKTLKKRIKTLEKEHSMELNRIHLDINQMKQMHTSQMDQLDSNFNSKLLYEFQNYDKLKDELKAIKESNQKKMAEIERARVAENEYTKIHHQREITEMQQKLLQLEQTYNLERKQSEETISNLKCQLVNETNTLKVHYESKLQAECQKFSDLKTELGITRKKLNMMQKEREELKSVKTAFDSEYENLKQKYNEATSTVGKLKKEIIEKEKNLETEKRIQSEIKKKIKETINELADKDRTINVLQIQLEERRNQLITYDEEMHKLKKGVRKEERGKIRFKTEIQQLQGKLRSKDSLLQQSRIKIHNLKVRLSNMQFDIRDLVEIIQEPDKLKNRVKEIHTKYSEKWQIKDST